MEVADFWVWLERQHDAALDAGILDPVFWNMTPVVLENHHAIYQRRETREYERAAWVVSRLMGAWVEKPPSVDELLGRMR